MTDRERILMNIAAILAEEVCTLQRLPSVREYMDNPHSLSKIRMEEGSAIRSAYQKGDLVLCQTSAGRKQNPWLLSFVEANGCKNDPNGLLLRAIGETQLCDYGNESFVRITGIPERLLWEGAKQRFSEKLHKALRKLDTFIHRFRGLSFPEDGKADVTFGEVFGGLSERTKPYTLRITYTPKTTIKNILEQLQEQGFGTRKFEPEDGSCSPFANPQPVTKGTLIGVLEAAEMRKENHHG